MDDLNRRLDWALVRSFIAVMDAGSVSAAARTTQGHQPTISRHLCELEAQLGVALFERTGRGVRPTAAGLEVLPAARQMQAAAEALARSVTRGREATRGTVRITASQVVSTWLLPPLVAEFQRAEPEIQVEIVSSNAVQNLLRREADIAVRMVQPDQGSLIARKVGAVAISAWAHADYLARHGTPRTAADLLGHRLIGYDKDDAILRGLARLGIAVTPAHFVARTDDQVVNAQLIAAGAGIGFAADYLAAMWPDVRPVLADLPIPTLPVWLTVHRELRGNGVVKRFYDFLAEAIPARLREGVLAPVPPRPRAAAKVKPRVLKPAASQRRAGELP
jgi:DNA-binding transcriptional LysR family regulator